LEIAFERELKNPGVRRRKNLGECGGLTPDIRRAEICMNESIEKLGSELEVTILIDVDFLRNREVEIRETGAAHDPNSSAPKCLRRGTQCGKRIGVEPTLDGSLRRWQLRIRNEVWPRHAIAAEIQSAAATENGGQWEPALQDMDPGDLPVSEEQIHRLRPRLTPSPSASPRQFVYVTDGDAVRDIKFCGTALGPEIVRILRHTVHADIHTRTDGAGR